METLLLLNIKSLEKAISLLQEIDYTEYTDIQDVKDFNNRIYQQINVCKVSLETYLGINNYK